MKNSRKTQKQRWQLLIMRPKGQVANLRVSPWFLLAALVFGLAFTVMSIIVINRHVGLYLEHQALERAYLADAKELSRLKSQMNYQASVAEDYAKLMKAMMREGDGSPAAAPEQSAGPAAAQNQGGLEAPAPEAVPAPAEPQGAPAQPSAAEAVSPLDALAGRLPEPGAPAILDVDRIQMSGGRFNFNLQNDDPSGELAQGYVMVVFELAGRDNAAPSLVAFPAINLNAPELDFTAGTGYSIRSSKPVKGSISLPAGSKVTSALVLAKSRDGVLTLKKKITF